MKKTELEGMEPIQDLLELTLWSAYIKGHACRRVRRIRRREIVDIL